MTKNELLNGSSPSRRLRSESLDSWGVSHCGCVVATFLLALDPPDSPIDARK